MDTIQQQSVKPVALQTLLPAATTSPLPARKKTKQPPPGLPLPSHYTGLAPPYAALHSRGTAAVTGECEACPVFACIVFCLILLGCMQHSQSRGSAAVTGKCEARSVFLRALCCVYLGCGRLVVCLPVCLSVCPSVRLSSAQVLVLESIRLLNISLCLHTSSFHSQVSM